MLNIIRNSRSDCGVDCIAYYLGGYCHSFQFSICHAYMTNKPELDRDVSLVSIKWRDPGQQ